MAMDDEKISKQNEAVQNLPALAPEELKKLENFTGTIEIPLPAPAAPTTENAEPVVENATADADAPAKIGGDESASPLSEEDFSDFEQLLWGGNMPDAPAVNFGDEYVVVEGTELPPDAEQAKMDDIVAAIKTVEDPELMLNVYDLGLIYRLDRLKNGDVEIDMTVTAPSCPVAGLMPKQVAEAVSKVAGVGKVTVTLVWEPAWTIDKMTDDAKLALNMF